LADLHQLPRVCLLDTQSAGTAPQKKLKKKGNSCLIDTHSREYRTTTKKRELKKGGNSCLVDTQSGYRTTTNFVLKNKCLVDTQSAGTAPQKKLKIKKKKGTLAPGRYAKLGYRTTSACPYQ
jgi:hypothetical protein